MKLRHNLLSFGLFFSMLTSSAVLAAELDQLQGLVKNHDYKAAYELADSMSAQYEGEPAFDLLYGVAAREAGHPEKAVFAFERAIMANKRDARSHYEMALALVKVKDFRGAKRSLENAQRLSSSATLKKNAAQLLRIVERSVNRERAPILLFQGAANIGYNSNINSSAIDYLNANTGPAIADGYATLSLSGYLEKKLTTKDSIYFSLASTNRKNFQSLTYDFNTLFGRIGFKTNVGGFDLRIPISTEFVALGYAGRVLSISAGLDLQTDWSRVHYLGIGADVKVKRYNAANNSQVVLDLDATYKGRFLDRTLAVDFSFFYNPTVARGDNGDIGAAVKDELGFRTQTRYEFIRRHSVLGEFRYANYNFWMPSLVGDYQNDNNLSFQVGYVWKFCDHWSVGPTYLLVYNQSNQFVNTYIRHQVQLGLTASF